MINNRQNGRRRGRSGNAPRPNGGGQPDRGSRLDNRARGNASQLHEKYKTLAADAQRQGDRVMTEYYLQFADHYFRVLSETRSRFEDQQQRRDRFDAQSDDFDDGEGGDEGYEERASERAPRGQEWERGEADGGRNRHDGNRHEGSRQGHDGNRQDREGNRGEYRGDGNRGEPREGVRGLEGPRVDAGRDRPERGDERGQREPRAPRDGFEPRQRRRGERQDDERQPVADQPAAPAPAIAPTGAVPAEAAAPAVAIELPLEVPAVERRPRGRPRKVVVAEPATDASERIDTDRLPPALSQTAVEGEDAPKPRRTRRPRGEAAAV